MIQITTGDAIGLFVAFAGFVAGVATLLLKMSDRRNSERFQLIDGSLVQLRSGLQKIGDMEKQMLQMKMEFVEQYVRRDDYVRGQTVIESKIDALATKIENLQLRSGASNVR